MAVTATYDFAEERGDTLDYDLTFTQAGDPVDITQPGTEIWFTAKTSVDRPDNQATFEKRLGSGIVIIATNIARVTIEPEDTAGLADGARLYWDTQIRFPGGRVQTPYRGTFTYEADIKQGTV